MAEDDSSVFLSYMGLNSNFSRTHANHRGASVGETPNLSLKLQSPSSLETNQTQRIQACTTRINWNNTAQQDSASVIPNRVISCALSDAVEEVSGGPAS